MAINFDPIEIPVVADEAGFRKSMGRVGDTAASMGKKIDKSSLAGIAGLRGLEVVATDAGRAIGITGEAASVFGRTVGAATEKLGKATVALGVLGIAAYGAYLIYDHFAESSRKLREETIKGEKAARSWLLAQGDAKEKTEGLHQAEYDLYLFRYEKEQKALAAGIALKEKEIKNLREEIAETEELGHKLWDAFGRGEQELAQKKEKVAEMRKELAVEREIQNIKAKSFVDFKGGGEAERVVVNQYAREAELEQRRVALLKATGASKEDVWKQEQKAFDMATAAKMAEAKSEQEYNDIIAQREIERATFVAEHEIAEAKRVADEKKRFQDFAWQYGTRISTDLLTMAVTHGKEGAKAAKNAARVQTIVSTAAGAMKAYEQMGAYGGYAAALIIAAGAVQLAKINSASYGGGGGVGGNASLIGLPSQQEQQPVNLTLIVNGETRNIGQLTEGVLRELYNNNGSVGGISVAVERSI